MVRVSSAWRLVRARSRRRVRGWVRAWRGSLQVRVITSTLAIGLVALALIGAYVGGRMADGLFNARLDQVLQESARSTQQAQKTFDSSTATTGTDVQRLLSDVAGAQRTGGSDLREVFVLRAPGQKGGSVAVSGAASDASLISLVSPELRLATAAGGQKWQSVAIPQDDGGVSPGVIVGQDVTVPVDGTYQLFFLYSLQSEQDRLDFLLRTLGLAAVALVVLLGSMTWLVTRQTVTPVRRAAQVAERLADGHLSERMPERGEDEMATLARSFNEMAESLQDQIHRMEELSTLQRRFVSDVSHELRTPLTTIRMAGEVIHASREDFDPASKRSAELLQTQLDRFEDLLADLLEISRFDAGAAVLDAEGRDVRDVVVQAVDHASPLADRRGAWLHVVVPEERVRRRHRPAARRAGAAQPAGQRRRALRGQHGRGHRRGRRARRRRDRARPRRRHDPRRGRARVRPVLARRPGPRADHGRDRPGPGDLARGRPPARRLARGLGPAGPRRELPAHAAATRGHPAGRLAPAAGPGRVAHHRRPAHPGRAAGHRPGGPAGPRHGRPRSRARREAGGPMTAHRLRRGVLAALAVTVLAACSAIPTSGPVQEGDTEVAEPSEIQVLAEGPQPGDTPAEIVDGFLAAGAAGFSDRFVTAREYLAGEAKATWKPLDGVVVSGPIEPVPTGTETEITVNVPVLARVDGGGRYTEAPPDAQESVTYGLVQDDDDEWRIGTVPDGLILQQEDFARSFRPAALYFLSPDDQFLVPETRWFPEDNLPTAIMSALIAGPSPWLRDAVDTAVPDGVELNPVAVPIDDGVATVRLEPQLAVVKADRDLLLAQIDASLRPVRGVGSIEVYAGDLLLEGTATLQKGEAPPGNVEFLQVDALVSLVDGKVVPVPGVGSLQGLDARSPASNADGSIRVMLSGPSTLTTMPTTEAGARTLWSGSGLAAPSVDRFGWVWTTTSAGGLVAVPVDGEPVPVAADWLDGRSVRAVRVARDGVRVAVVSAGADGVQVDVAAVTRDDSGSPQQLGAPVRTGASLVDATSVAWSEESTLAVVGRTTGNPTVHLVPVAGPSTALPEVAKLAGMAASTVIYVTTTDGSLRRFVGSTWASVTGVTGASDPTFPG